MVTVRQGAMDARRRESGFAIGRTAVFALTAIFEIALIIVSSVMAGMGYHLAIYGSVGPVEQFTSSGLLVALCFTLPFIVRSEYRTEDFLASNRRAPRVFLAWNYAFFCLIVIGVLTKTTDLLSRGWLVFFYSGGLIGVIGYDIVVGHVLRKAIATGRVAVRKVMAVGTTAEVERFKRDLAAVPSGIEIVATARLPDGECSEEDLRAALRQNVDVARQHNVDDVVLLSDWLRTDTLLRSVDCMEDLPATVHLGRLGTVERFANLRIERLGGATTLALTHPPLSLLNGLAKRTLDIVLASMALLMLVPLLAIVAVQIKRDSKGPVFFRQRRLGFNKQEFRIWKFRSMTTMDDGDQITQAQPDDERVTRMGAFLRRSNIDELPQLLNVIKGDMSLVGPRPHAVAHDVHFEPRIASYARRLNVKPGITGWAQINGFRGPTQTDAQMRERVACDLYYIDNCSLCFDLYIMAMTVVSKKAFRNAL